MKKRLLLIICVMILSIISAYSSIGENFARGGVAVSGDVRYNFNLMFSDHQLNSFSSIVGLNCDLSFYLIDNFAFKIYDNFSFNYLLHYLEFLSWDYSGYFPIIKVIRNEIKQYSLSNTIGIGFSYYFFSKKLNNIAVPYLETDFGLKIQPGLGRTFNDNFEEDKSLTLSPQINQGFGVYIFLKDRIALDVSTFVTFDFPIQINDSNGDLSIYQSPFENVNIYGGGKIGIVFFIPTKDKVIAAF